MTKKVNTEDIQNVDTLQQEEAGDLQQMAVDVLPDSGSVVVLALAGTEEKMQLVWERMYPGHVKVITDPGSLHAALLEAMAAEDVTRRFVLVPANLIPTHPVEFEMLSLPFMEERSDRTRSRWGCVPMAFEKDKLVDFLSTMDEKADDKAIADAYASLSDSLPLAVGHGFGNFIAKVMRGNPCEHLLIEALLTRHFIYSNKAGWPSVERLVDKSLGR